VDLHFTFSFILGGCGSYGYSVRESPVDGDTDRSGDLEDVGRYRGTRDNGEKGDGRYISLDSFTHVDPPSSYSFNFFPKYYM
jgi:hypothetical protein